MSALEQDAFGRAGVCVTYPELRRLGYTRQEVENALESGHLFRARRNVYLWRSATLDERRAARVGGRVDCTTVLRSRGIFVLDREDVRLHVQVSPSGSRLRSATDRKRRLRCAEDGVSIQVHWRGSDADGADVNAPLIEALAQAMRCQGPRAGLASIDSALHQGLIRQTDLSALFASLPPRFQRLRGLVDGRAESGSETFARLIARATGRSVEVQKRIPGVGRVDLVVDGWIVIECDSREFHEGWEKQAADRLRDLELAALGYAVLRPTAHLLFTSPDILIKAIRGLLAAGRR
ncbi:hypothetical protein [Microbacterium rhizophilus]|uniref:hypothetical protein n=1 Tax=Microbacterium rhizophilus TaxID=3138934 RepID=UPI0031F01364